MAGIRSCDRESQVQSPNHYTTEPPCGTPSRYGCSVLLTCDKINCIVNYLAMCILCMCTSYTSTQLAVCLLKYSRHGQFEIWILYVACSRGSRHLLLFSHCTLTISQSLAFFRCAYRMFSLVFVTLDISIVASCMHPICSLSL